MPDKPWNALGMSKSMWSATQTPWGREGLTKEKYLEREGLTPYLYKKLERGEQMRALQARKIAEAAAAAASRQPGTGTSRTRSAADEGQEVEEDDEDDDGASRGRGGAPSPDSDADYSP